MVGRKSRRNIITFESKKLWKVGVYCRLSSEDGDNAESDSIVNQKELISLYISKEKDLKFIDYYIDDGCSGTTFLRPDFKRLLKDITNERINTIIVKDLSRFGRNYIEVGKYIEQVFPLYNVRFIAINDNIDSFKDPKSINNVIVPFKNLLNDEYARDISNKVKSIYKTKALKGEFVGGTTPYGYTKDKNNKYKLVIDKKEAKNVKLIYELYLKGWGQIKICKYLNDNKILGRKEIQRREKRKIDLEPNADIIKYKWSKSTIGKILTNETYIGNVVQNRTTTVSYKNHKTIYKPREEWIVVKNTHEPIINKNDFERVQEILKNRNYDRKSTTNLSIYYGKLKCADCGSGMCKMEDFRGNRKCSNYYCRNYKTTSSHCSPHKIKTVDLNNLVLETILMQIKLVLNVEKTIEKAKNNGIIKDIEQKYNYNLNKLNSNLDKYKKLKKSLYEDWKLENITEEKYLLQAKEYEKNIENINNEINVLEKVFNENIQNLKKDNYWIDHFKKNKNIKEINREIINDLIDKIYVHEGGNITIKFKYEDEFNKAIELLKKQEGMYE